MLDSRAQGRQIDRRSVLKASGVTLATSFAGCLSSGTGSSGGKTNPADLTREDFQNPSGYEDTFNLMNWNIAWVEWAQEQLANDFPDLNSINHAGFTAAEEFFTKLQSGNHDIDNVTSLMTFTQRCIDNDLISPLPIGEMPNVQEYVLDEILEKYQEELSDDEGNQYAVPDALTFNPSLGYNSNVIPEPPNSWDVLWDDAYEGEIILQDQARNTVSMAARYTGQDPRNPSDWQDIKEALIQQKPLVKTYWSDYSQAFQMFINESAVVGTLSMARLFDAHYGLSHDSPNKAVNWTIPKEGSHYFPTELIIPSNAPHPHISTLFTNWALHPDNAFKLFETMGYFPPIKDTQTLLKEAGFSQEQREFVDWQGKFGDRLEFFGPMDDELRKKYDQIWTEVKAA